MTPVGYVVMQHAVRLDRPVKAYERWMERIPSVYREMVLDERPLKIPPKVSEDPNCLAALKHYRSLMSLAQEARKPMFHLKAADGVCRGGAGLLPGVPRAGPVHRGALRNPDPLT